jgi:hypothetical protein
VSGHQLSERSGCGELLDATGIKAKGGIIMGFLDTVAKINDKLASDKMRDKVEDAYLKGKVSQQQFENYQKALEQHQKRRGNK